MAVDQTAIPKDLRPLNLGRTAAPSAPNLLPPSPDVLLASAHQPHGNNSPRSRVQYYPVTTTATVTTTVVSPILDSAAAFSPAGFPNPVAAWPTVLYPHQLPLPNGFAEQAVASNVAGGGTASSNDGPDEQLRYSSTSSSISSKKVKFLCSFGGKILPRPSDGALRYVGGHTRIIALRKDTSFQEVMQKMSETYGGPAVLKYQLPDEDLDALVTVSCPEDLENMMEEYDKLAESSAEGSAKLRVFLFSPAELDVSGLSFASDVSDTGQRYVDAVNGFPEKELAGMRRKESLASLSSTHTSDGVPTELLESTTTEGMPSAIAPPIVAATGTATSQESSRSLYPDGPLIPMFSVSSTTTLPGNVTSCAGIPPPQILPTSRLDQPLPPSVGTTYVPPAYMEPLQDGFNRVDYIQNLGHVPYLNPQQLGAHVSFVAAPQHSYLSSVHSTAAVPAAQVSTGNSVRGRVEPYLDDGSFGGRTPQVGGNPSYRPFQALSQLPPLPPLLLQAQGVERYGLYQMPPPGMPPVQTLKFEDCGLCQRALPHVHSDTLMQEHGGSIPSKSPSFHSLHSDEMARTHAPLRVGSAVGHQPEGSITPSHLGAYGHTQPAESQQDIGAVPLETENLGKTKVMHPQVLGFAGTLQAPYGIYLSNPTQSWCEDILQQQQPPLGQPSQYLLKQDNVISHPVGTNLTSARNEAAQKSEPTVQDAGAESLYEYTKPVEGMMEAPHLNHSQLTGMNEHRVPAGEPNLCDAALIEGTMGALHINPSETSGIIEPWKAATKVNASTKDVLKPESLPLVGDTLDNFKPNILGSDAFLVESSVSPGRVAETNSAKLVDLLPPSTSEVTCLPKRQLGDPNQVCPVLENLEPHSHIPELGIEPPIPHERLLQGPSATTKIAVSDWKDESSRLYSGNTFNDTYACSSGTVPITLSSMSTHNVCSGDIPEPAPSESLFSNMEPWQIMHHSHLPPPKPTRVASRDTLLSRDSYTEKRSGNSGESQTTAWLEEGSYHQPFDSLSKNTRLDTNTVHLAEGTAEELIKQELQAVAEGVAASVLKQSIPLPGQLLACENNSLSGSSKDKAALEDNMDSQSSAFLVGQKAEDIKIGQSDKSNLGFQIMEDIGRLQIIRNSDLEELRELGSGTFGTVYHGKWRGSDVAIKRINDRCFAGKQSEQERLMADFWNEACKLADLHHPNVVAFYGVVIDGPGGSVATVTEYMVNGSLRQAWQRNHKTLDRRKRILIAMDVAFGMEYLHGKNIVHFDLKSDNLLVNLRDPQRPICKVGDLGLSKVKCQTLISGGVRGTLPWMAPELLNGSSSLVSEKVDVFSFGIVMWELLTGEEPYADLHYGAIIGGIVSNTLRPPIPESCDPEWRSLMEKCWSSEPSERPSFKEIANTLRAMAASIPQKGQAQVQTPALVQPKK